MGFVIDSGLDMIRKERENQLAVRGFDDKHDDVHVNGELALAAAFYAHPGQPNFTDTFPLNRDLKSAKRDKHSRIKQLAIAGALCAAEIDRLRRAGKK